LQLKFFLLNTVDLIGRPKYRMKNPQGGGDKVVTAMNDVMT
jgi:hypothetical protein